jgi:hypothetical protein
MARLKTELVDARETFVFEAFKANPSPSIKEVNSLLKSTETLGKKEMAPNRIYAIRDAAVAGNPLPAKVSHKKEKTIAQVIPVQALPVMTQDAAVSTGPSNARGDNLEIQDNKTKTVGEWLESEPLESDAESNSMAN